MKKSRFAVFHKFNAIFSYLKEVAGHFLNKTSHFFYVPEFAGRLPPSKSEDHLLLTSQTASSSSAQYPRSRSSTLATGSVSATSSPLFPTKHLTDSLTDSLQSISSDESTAAVVSLPVTTPRTTDTLSNKKTAPSILSGNAIPVNIQLNSDRYVAFDFPSKIITFGYCVGIIPNRICLKK